MVRDERAKRKGVEIRPSDEIGWRFDDPRLNKTAPTAAHRPDIQLAPEVGADRSADYVNPTKKEKQVKTEEQPISGEGQNRGTTQEKLLKRKEEMLRGGVGQEKKPEKSDDTAELEVAATKIVQAVFGEDVFERNDDSILTLETALFNTYLSLPEGVNLDNWASYPEEQKKIINGFIVELRKAGVTDQEMGQIKSTAHRESRELREKREQGNQGKIIKLLFELKNTVKYRRPDLGLGDEYPEDKINELSAELAKLGVHSEMIKKTIEAGNNAREHWAGNNNDKLIEAGKFWYNHNLEELEGAVRINLHNVELSRRESGGKIGWTDPSVVRQIEDLSSASTIII